MKNKLIKILLLILFIAIPVIPETNSFYLDEEKTLNNTISTGCWSIPSVPELVYPPNNYYAGTNSMWNINPYMDWTDSTSPCPPSTTMTYQYESYRDSGLTVLLYRSGWLTSSQIPAGGTPEGTYYWRVRAKDSFDNMSNFSSVWLLTVDRTAPVSQFTSPVPNTNVSGSPIDISGNSTDNFGVDSVELLYTTYESGACQATYTTITTIDNPVNNTPFSWNNSWTPPASGNYCIKAEATDVSGNTELSPVVENITFIAANETPKLEATLNSDNKYLSFKVLNIIKFVHLSYEITYDTDSEPEGILGSSDLSNQTEYVKDNIVMGTCSSGGTCVFHSGVKNVKVKVQLKDNSANTTDLEKLL